jgi:hypothetical protein
MGACLALVTAEEDKKNSPYWQEFFVKKVDKDHGHGH